MENALLTKNLSDISRLAFGGMSLSGEPEAAHRLIQQAVDAGITFFDTADLYDAGNNERILGAALKPHRSNIVLATKAGNRLRPDGQGWDWCADPAYIRLALENSLLRLQTDYVDLFQLHGGTLDDPIEDIVALFEELKTEGKIRAYGISSIRPAVIREWLRVSTPDTVMMQLGVLDPRPLEAVTALLHNRQVTLLARGVLAKGLLAGKKAQPWLDWDETAVAGFQEKYLALDHEGRSPAQTALAYVLKLDPTHMAVVGFRTEAQLTELTHHFPALSDEGFAALQALQPPFVYNQHR